MRLLLKQNIMRMLSLMKNVQGIVSQQWGSQNKDRLFEWLTQLQEAAMEIGEAIESQETQREYDKALINCLEEYCELLYGLSQAMDDKGGRGYSLVDACDRKLADIHSCVKGIPLRIKIGFFPYKYSMWDSLESIWRAACKDERCECQVVPIPYYDKGEDGKLEEMHYEGKNFPKDIPIVDYYHYSIEAEKLDIVYIHNPYDEYNRITCVHPVFFMEELKKYGANMVYVPYYMAGYFYRIDQVGNSYKTKGSVLSDYIVLQSDNLKKAYECGNIDSKKIIVTGSPKIDKVYKLIESGSKGKEAWKPTIKNRKVLLLNSTISAFLTDSNWGASIYDVIEHILSDKSMVLIWRPHPLLFQTIRTMRKDYIETYQELCSKVQEAENGILDESDDFGDAMTASDGMISDYSSLVLQYTFSGKPALLLQGSSDGRKSAVFCDFFSNYFVSDGTTVEDFIQMIKEGKDEKKEERLRMAKASVVNGDGTCGEKTHEAVIKIICFWE